MLQEMTTEKPKPRRGRPPAPPAPPKDKATLNLPPGTKDKIRKAMAAETMMGNNVPEDVSTWVAALIEREVKDVLARYEASLKRK